jgi:hypothetical protein
VHNWVGCLALRGAVAELAQESWPFSRAMGTARYPCVCTACGTVCADHVVGLQDIHPPGRPVAEHGDRYPQANQTIDGRRKTKRYHSLDHELRKAVQGCLPARDERTWSWFPNQPLERSARLSSPDPGTTQVRHRVGRCWAIVYQTLLTTHCTFALTGRNKKKEKEKKKNHQKTKTWKG